ncbi:MAG: NhaP-type Na+/H+ or K+/H+ antiporter [Natronomonas sp.]
MVTGSLPIIAGILVLGIGAQLLARRLRVPSVLFLIFIGLALGEFGLGYVTLETFGAGLSAIVGLSVAIIVFDGAFHLQVDRLRMASMATLRLVTVGAVVTLVGTAVVVRMAFDADWPLALLVGALLIATGPTVITPVLEVVRVRDHVAAALESEGLINDVTAALAAVVIYEVLVLGGGSGATSAFVFLQRFGIGVGAGLLAVVLVYVLLNYEITAGDAPQASRFLVLSAAVGSFALAEAVAAEAGIAAAATAGLVLGNLDLPHHETMAQFGRDTTLIVLSFVFISLAALIDLRTIAALGFGAVALVVAIIFVIRPLVVWLSTYNLGEFTRSERVFMSAVAPRGIVPASVATLFAIELSTAGEPAAAQLLAGSVFVVIFTTVVLEGGLARQIGDTLGVTRMRTLIVGGGRVGRALATRLENRGEFVVIVEADDEQTRQLRESGFTVHPGDGTEADVLTDAGIEEAKIVVAATNDDEQNLFICQLAASKFDVEALFSRVNHPENVAAFDSLNVTAIDASTATAMAIDNEIERPALSHWMTDVEEGHDVQEIEVTAEELAGQTIEAVNARIPDGCIVAAIGRDGETHVPSADDALEYGDSVTFLGDSEAVERAVRRFHPHD